MVKSKNDIAFEILVLVIITLVGLACLIPILFVISYSLTPMEEMLRNGGFSLIPRNITFSAYKQMLNDPTLMNAMKVSAFITIVGTAANLVVTLMLAYPLSRSYLPGRKVFVQLIVFTMIFSAGTIPTYLIVKATHILNTLWALILPSLVAVYNFIVMKAFFEGLPNDLFESARIDGASELRMFFSIALPLSGSIIAVMALYYGVGRWNEFFNALIYVSNVDYQPLQLVLRSLLLQSQQAVMDAALTNDPEMLADAARLAYMAEAMKYAIIFIAAAPLLIAYPFVQKHFVRGVMIGALKG